MRAEVKTIAPDLLSGSLGVNFEVDGFIAAFLAALAISAVSFALSRLLRRNPLGTGRLT